MPRARQKRLCRSTFFAALLFAAPFTVAQADSTCRYSEQADLEIAHGDRSAHATIAGEINGKPVRMLLDTGASDTFVLRAEADRQGLNPERIQRQVRGVGGSSSIFLVKVKDFAIGGAHVKNLRFPVVEGLDDSGLAAIVGVDFLMQYDVELNFAANRVKLFRANGCADKGLAYWDPDAMTVPMLDAPDNARPMVQVKINGVSLTALVDTGAGGTTIDRSALRQLGLSTDAPGVSKGGKAVGIGSEERTLWHMTFDSFAIGDELIQRPRIAVLDDKQDVIAGVKLHQVVLGRDFLKAHHVLLAKSQMLFYYTYLGGPVFLEDSL